MPLRLVEEEREGTGKQEENTVLQKDWMSPAKLSLEPPVCRPFLHALWLPRWLSGKESACNARDVGLIPGLGRYPGEGNGNPLQYSSLENSMDRGAWWATVYGASNSQTQLKQLSTAH